eukprot:856250-Pyramimonas_sp.AAC.2
MQSVGREPHTSGSHFRTLIQRGQSSLATHGAISFFHTAKYTGLGTHGWFGWLPPPTVDASKSVFMTRSPPSEPSAIGASRAPRQSYHLAMWPWAQSATQQR